MTQLVRIELGKNVEEAHMRNRQLIAKWAYEKGKEANVIELKKRDGKTYVVVNDYPRLRELFGTLLAEIQRIKSEGDYAAGKNLVEGYGVKVDPELHAEVLERYAKLNLAPYKGFVNPVMKEVKNLTVRLLISSWTIRKVIQIRCFVMAVIILSCRLIIINRWKVYKTR